jgi:hypothetical protein
MKERSNYLERSLEVGFVGTEIERFQDLYVFPGERSANHRFI